MPQQYTLVARPIVLSENKRNVILHGRPLTPIGTVRSARPFFVPRQQKGSFAEEKHGDNISINKPPTAKTSAISLVDYHKLANENLMTINNNLSLMLKESFAGIDNICQKVRLCLLEANTIKPPENLQSSILENPEIRKVENLEISKVENIATRKVANRTENSISDNLDTRTIQYRRESFQLLSTCDEEVESNASIDEVPDITEDTHDISAEIVDENEEVSEKEYKKKQNKPAKFKRVPSITPFFTILNPRTQSAESVGVNIIRALSSKIGISRKCTTESFNETMKEVEQLTDYEDFLTSMVEGINREIEQCYSHFPKIEQINKNDQDKNVPKDTKKEKDGRPASARGKKRKRNFSSELKKFNEIHKNQRDLIEDQYSENDLTYRNNGQRRMGICIYPVKTDFTYPDVYRKRAITDLHKRLEAQIEANDSLIFFQKLMAKSMKHMTNDRPSTANGRSSMKPAESTFKSPMQYLLSAKRPEGKKPRSLADLTKKYQDSLWFKQKKPEIKRCKKEPTPIKKKKEKKGKKEKHMLPQSYTLESRPIIDGKTTVIQKTCFKTPSQGTAISRPLSTVAETKTLQKASICNCRIKVTNNQPLSDAQKCKIHWMRAKYSQLRQKKLKYLDILDDITKNDLLPLQAEYPRRDQIKNTAVKESYLHKLIYGKNMETQNAWNQLFQPSTVCSQENCKKCSTMSIVHDDEKENEYKETREPNLIHDRIIEPNYLKNILPIEMKSTYDLDKGDVIRKLSKYIFADDAQSNSPKHVFTVMPVHVFYDNTRLPPDARRLAETPLQKLPLLPMKETKDFTKKAEWNDANNRTKSSKVVYDPILRKIEKEIRTSTVKSDRSGNLKMGQTSSWSPKNFAQYCSPQRQSPESRLLIKINTVDKTSQRQRYPVSASRAIPIAELFKRSPKPSREKVNNPGVSCSWNSPNVDVYKYQKGNVTCADNLSNTEVRRKIQKTISAEATSRMKTDQQRKIWEYKYGKSVGQKLLHFIEKQPDQYQTPVPKYALPNKHGPKAANHPVKHQIMLDQLRNLKQKNDNIQTNIQKAIQVIENKMMDILSKPTTSESIEAFDAMEKEITNVLSLMKTSSSPKTVSKKEKTVVDYGGDISDELFRRLDRILESPGMSGSGKSSKNSSRKEEKVKRKTSSESNGCQKSTDMNQVCFSSTSATGEEKFTITAISPKRTFKGPTSAPYIKNTTDQPSPDDVSTISTELRKLENELKIKDGDQPNPEAEIAEVEPMKEQMPIKRSSILKHRMNKSGQEQVVNIALVAQTNQEGSAGDQLQELKKLLENELKSAEASDEKTHSIADLFSQGDYGVKNVVKGGEDERHSQEKISENTELDVDSVLEENAKSIGIDQETEIRESLPKIPDGTKPIPEEIEQKSTEIPIPRTPGSQQLKESQLSLDMTGPYFTPLTSPLTKTRCQIDEIEEEIPCPSIVEEETQFSYRESELLKHNGQADGADVEKQKCYQENDVQYKNEEEHLMYNKGDDDATEVCSKKEEEAKSQSIDDESDSEKSEKDSFYENVNKIISRVENVYNQLEEFEEEMMQEASSLSLVSKEAVFQDNEPPEMGDHEADLFLTPFMHAVKDLRKNVEGEKTSTSRKSNPKIKRSSSLYNVLSFLDNLSDFREEKPVEVRTPRMCLFAYIVHIPQIFHQLVIQHQSSFTPLPTVPEEETLSDPSSPVQEGETLLTSYSPLASIDVQTPFALIREEPKKKTGCLKTPFASHTNVNAITSKSKQKVSFLLLKEEKSTQVTSCPFHSVSRILIQQSYSSASTENSVSVKRDAQSSAYLDAHENKSVDKMSLPDDETYQNTFEFSDEISSVKSSKMPEQFVQNLQETLERDEEEVLNAKQNVVEIFKNSYTEENVPADVKVFREKSDIGKTKNAPEEGNDRKEEKVDSKKGVTEAIEAVSKEEKVQPSVKVFYDTYKSERDQVNFKLLRGVYNEQSILQVQNSLGKDIALKKQNSLEKLLKNLNEEIISTHILRESSLLEPLKNLNEFIDSKLLKEAVEKRQAIRMMRRQSSLSMTTISNKNTSKHTYREIHIGDGDKENLLKGFYVFVYLLMFTALNLEYKCVQ